MRFISKSSFSPNPLTLILNEKKTEATQHDNLELSFSLYTESHQQMAFGECAVQHDDSGTQYLDISAIYVEEHTNRPTLENPNKYNGLGKILVFTAIRFGFQHNIKNAQLMAVSGSEGFYLKMGFHRKAYGYANRMVSQNRLERSTHGKLNKNWLNAFQDASSRHTTSLIWPIWDGSISNLYPRLRKDISRDWLIME